MTASTSGLKCSSIRFFMWPWTWWQKTKTKHWVHLTSEIQHYKTIHYTVDEPTFVITVGGTITHMVFVPAVNTKESLQLISTTVVNNYYQGFVSFINESVMEDSQALISPDTHKLGDSQKPVREKTGKANTFKNIDF